MFQATEGFALSYFEGYLLGLGAGLLAVAALKAVTRRPASGANATAGSLPKNLRLEHLPGGGPDDRVLVVPGREVPLRFLDKGGFAQVYRDAESSGRVYAVTPSFVRDKDAAADAHAELVTNHHLPAVERVGCTVGGERVYAMPHYRGVYSSPRVAVLQDLELLGWCDADARATHFYQDDVDPEEQHPRTTERVRAYQEDVLSLAAARGVTPAVVEALRTLDRAGHTYSDEFNFDFPQKNFAVDAAGNLVLLDVLWDGHAARRRLRGFPSPPTNAFASAAVPFVNVELRGDCRGKKCPVVRGKAKLDTGAGATFIRDVVVEKLDLERLGRGKIYGVAGGKRPITLDRYAIGLSFPGSGLGQVPLDKRGAYAKADLGKLEGHVVLLGRDAMAGGDGGQGMRLEYDGPSGQVKVKPSGRRGKRRGKKGRRR